MNLAFVLFRYFPFGGLQRNFLRIAMELVERGHQVTVFTGSWEDERPSELSIEDVAISGYSNAGRNQSFYSNVSTLLKKRDFDLVVGFNKMPGLDVYYCADTCFATRVHEEKHWWERLTRRVRLSMEYEDAVFGAASKTHVLLLSEAEGDAYTKYYATQANRFHLMPPGIAKDRVRNADSATIGRAVREQLSLDFESKVMIFLGSDYKRKGLLRTLQALASLPTPVRQNTRLLVVGQDKRQAKYQKKAQHLGVAQNVLFLGKRTDIPGLLFASDLLIHPAHLENTGNVIVEALVAGAPVLCSGTCGYAHYVRDNDLGAVIEEPFSQSRCNQELLRLLEQDTNWPAKCAEFASRADVFSRPLRAAETLEKVYQEYYA